MIAWVGDESGDERPGDLRPEELTDEDLERELTIAAATPDVRRLDMYERLLREKAERRVRREREETEPD